MTIPCMFRGIRNKSARRAGWLLATALMLTAAPGPAAEEAETDPVPDPQAEALLFGDAVTVTAPPIVEGNGVDRYGSVVGTVSERQIDDLHAQDLTSALRRLPGVVISRYPTGPARPPC